MRWAVQALTTVMLTSARDDLVPMAVTAFRWNTPTRAPASQASTRPTVPKVRLMISPCSSSVPRGGPGAIPWPQTGDKILLNIFKTFDNFLCSSNMKTRFRAEWVVLGEQLRMILATCLLRPMSRHSTTGSRKFNESEDMKYQSWNVETRTHGYVIIIIIRNMP